RIGVDPARYAADFFDVTTGNNTDTLDPPTPVPGYPATTGWDPVTGLGTPNAAILVPDLVAAVHGHYPTHVAKPGGLAPARLLTEPPAASAVAVAVHGVRESPVGQGARSIGRRGSEC